MQPTRRVLQRAIALVYRPYVRWRISRPTRIRLFGRPMFTDPRVFNPQYFLSSRLLVDELATMQLEGRHVLDMGTGSGVVALAAHHQGAHVTACDVNPHAVELARRNAALNQARIEVVESDLFAAPALQGRCFDVIAFNVPFYRGQARTPLQHAFLAGSDGETIRRFAADSARFLAPDGVLVLLFSEDSGRASILAMVEQAGFAVASERVVRKVFEHFHILRLKLTAAAAGPSC